MFYCLNNCSLHIIKKEQIKIYNNSKIKKKNIQYITTIITNKSRKKKIIDLEKVNKYNYIYIIIKLFYYFNIYINLIYFKLILIFS